MKNINRRSMLIASLAGALALPAGGLLAQDDKPKEPAKVHCYGVNRCKATGDCGGAGHSCANQNACRHKGYVDMDKDTCLKLDGGRLTEAAEKPAAPKKSTKSEKKG